MLHINSDDAWHLADGEPLAEDRLEEKLSEVSTPHGGFARLLSTITMILQRTGTIQKSRGIQHEACHVEANLPSALSLRRTAYTWGELHR